MKDPTFGHTVFGCSLLLWAFAHRDFPGPLRPGLLPGEALALTILALSMLLVLNERECQVTEGNMAGLSMLNLPDPEIHSGQEIQAALDRVLGRLEDVLQTGFITLWTGPPLQPEPARVTHAPGPTRRSCLVAAGGLADLMQVRLGRARSFAASWRAGRASPRPRCRARRCRR